MGGTKRVEVCGAGASTQTIVGMAVFAASLAAGPNRIEGQVPKVPSNHDSHAALSPDGSRVVFQSRRSGASDLYWMESGGSFPRRLTESEGASENASWSSDGRLIAFDSDRSGTWQLHVMAPDGEGVRQVTRMESGARDPSFTADGSGLLFVSPVDGVDQVMQIPLSGGAPRTLTTSSGAKSQPTQSHDGLRIAYVRSTPGGAQLRVARSTEEDAVTVLELGTGRRFVSGLGWTPQGELVFASNRGGRGRYYFRTSVYTLRPDGGGLRRRLSGDASHNNPSLSRDGSTLAFDSFRYGGADVFVGGADGSGLRNLTRTAGTEFFPTPHPDGVRVVFQSERDGQREIYVMDRDGTNVRNLTDHPADDRAPSLSGDGAVIAFASFRDSDWGDLYTMDMDGGNLTKVTPHGFFEELDQFPIATEMTPDGEAILFESAPVLVQGEAHWDIWRIDRHGGRPVRLTNTSGTARSSMPRVSPDGRDFLYFSNDSGDFEIYRMPVDGGRPTRLTDTPTSETYADWTPDGHSIYFSTARDGHSEVYRMGLDGDEARRVTFGAPDATHYAPRLSPDGRDLWVASNEGGTTELHRMAPDGSGEVRVTAPWGPDPATAPVSRACRGFSALGQPHWSWARNEIAFPGDCGGSRGIYVYDVDADRVQKLELSVEASGLDSPAWSNGGDRIAFNAEDGSGRRDLYLHDLATSGTRRLTHDAVHGGWVTWSPDDAWLNGYGPDEGGRWTLFRVRVADGSRVGVAENRGGDQFNLTESTAGKGFLYASELRIWRLAAEGSEPSPVTPGRLAAFMPHWAPGRGRFVFDGNAGLGWNLYIGRDDGAEPIPLTRRPERDSNATWSPDGRTVVYLCDVDGIAGLCLVDVETRRARILFRP